MDKIIPTDRLALIIIFPLLVYFVAGQLFASATMTVQGFYYFRHALELMLILIIAYLIWYFKKLTHPSAITFIIILWILWIVPTSLVWGSDVSLREYLQENLVLIIFWPLIYLLFYVFSLNNPSSNGFWVFLFACLAIISGCIFLLVFNFRNAVPTRSAMTGEALASLNQIYYPLSLLPWILLVKRPIHRFVSVSLIAILVFCAMKRAALIAFILSMVAYLIVHLIVKPKFRAVNLISPLIFAVIVAGLFIFYDETHGGYFTYRLQSLIDDQGSGRLDIYRDTIGMICDSSPRALLIGNGFDRVAKDSTSGLSAHCDWLEVIYDFGIFSFILYVLLNVFLVIKAWKLIRVRASSAAAFSAGYVLYFVISLMSHLIIFPSYFMFIVAFWGMIEGQGAEGPPINSMSGRRLIYSEVNS